MDHAVIMFVSTSQDSTPCFLTAATAKESYSLLDLSTGNPFYSQSNAVSSIWAGDLKLCNSEKDQKYNGSGQIIMLLNFQNHSEGKYFVYAFSFEKDKTYRLFEILNLGKLQQNFNTKSAFVFFSVCKHQTFWTLIKSLFFSSTTSGPCGRQTPTLPDSSLAVSSAEWFSNENQGLVQNVLMRPQNNATALPNPTHSGNVWAQSHMERAHELA